MVESRFDDMIASLPQRYDEGLRQLNEDETPSQQLARAWLLYVSKHAPQLHDRCDHPRNNVKASDGLANPQVLGTDASIILLCQIEVIKLRGIRNAVKRHESLSGLYC